MDYAPLEFGGPAEGEERHEGVLSLVTDDAGDKGFGRRLPSVYLGRALLHASRRVEDLGAKLQETVETLRSSQRERIYLAQACRSGSATGIYAGELNTRGLNRKRLERIGFTFSADPFTRFTEGQTWSCADFGAFSPSFIMLLNPHGHESLVANAVFSLAARRLWCISGSELGELTSLASTTPVVGGLIRDQAEARRLGEVMRQHV